MAGLKRRSATESTRQLKPADRSSSTSHGIALAPVTAPVEDPGPVAVLDTLATDAQPAIEEETASEAAVATPAGSGVWDMFELPSMPIRRPKARTTTALLTGASVPVPLYLPGKVLSAAKAVELMLRTGHGGRFRRGVLLSYTLAYGYAHYTKWENQVPTDARRRGAHQGALTVAGTRVVVNICATTREFGDTLLFYRQGVDPDHGPSLASLQATAVAWSLSVVDEWAPEFTAWTNDQAVLSR